MSEVKTIQWSPKISEKQVALMNDRHRYILASGPRWSTKTIGCLNRLCWEAWTKESGHISIVDVSTTHGSDGGVWKYLHSVVLKQWIAGDFGMRYAPKGQPHMDHASHKLICDVTNRHGGITRIQLDSLNNESDVEAIFKGKSYSMVYIPEASLFFKRQTFDAWQECLRNLPQLRFDDYVMLLDTNPSDEGTDSWLYKLFYLKDPFDTEVLKTYGVTEESELPLEVQEEKLAFRNQLSLHEFRLEDNIWASPTELAIQKGKYRHDPDLFARYVDGKWVKSSGTGWFSTSFRPETHCPGDEGEELLPEEYCSELATGWDIGDINQSAHIIEPVWLFNPTTNREQVSFKVLADIVDLTGKMLLEDLVFEMLERMDGIENGCAEKPLLWRHISDLSAFGSEMSRDAGKSCEADEVFSASDGRIILERGPTKGPGSIRTRVNLLRKLLCQDRIWISRSCLATREMLSNLKKGKTAAVDKQSPYKHPFDSLTYPLMILCSDEIQQDMANLTRPAQVPGSSVVRMQL